MKNVLDGPIPGENYTSDTRNYPWHRPPDITSIDEGIEYSMKKITGRNEVGDLVTLAQAGIPLSKLADIFVTANIGLGKWTPDFAILLAGPVTRIMEMICKGYDIDYDLGVDEPPMMTFEVLAAAMPKSDKKPEKNIDIETPPAPKTGGFMGRSSKTVASSEEQTSMLGGDN